MAKRITCTNKENGVAVIFDYNFAPFFLKAIDGIYKVSNNIQRADNTNTDGSTYQGANTQERNIVIDVEVCENYQQNRDVLYKCFERDSEGTLTYEEGSVKREIDYYTESIDVDEKGVVRGATISLVATDPYFKDTQYSVALMASWQKVFKFPHKFTKEKEELGTRRKELIKDVGNKGTVGRTGMVITLAALGTVTNPVINNITTGEFVKINTELQAGDVLEICTETNKKNVYLTRDTKKNSINGYIDEDSDFIQLRPGTNTLRYGADTGVDNLNVTVEYKCKYTGV